MQELPDDAAHNVQVEVTRVLERLQEDVQVNKVLEAQVEKIAEAEVEKPLEELQLGVAVPTKEVVQEKGKLSVQKLLQLQMLPPPRRVDEAVGSSNVFSLEWWQTHLQIHVQEIMDAYNDEVDPKLEAQNQHDQMSDAY